MNFLYLLVRISYKPYWPRAIIIMIIKCHSKSSSEAIFLEWSKAVTYWYFPLGRHIWCYWSQMSLENINFMRTTGNDKSESLQNRFEMSYMLYDFDQLSRLEQVSPTGSDLQSSPSHTCDLLNSLIGLILQKTRSSVLQQAHKKSSLYNC